MGIFVAVRERSHFLTSSLSSATEETCGCFPASHTLQGPDFGSSHLLFLNQYNWDYIAAH